MDWVSFISIGNRLKIRRHAVRLSHFLNRKAGHLMDEQSQGGCFDEQIPHRQAHIVKRMTIRFACLFKIEPGDRNHQDGRELCPLLILFHQTIQQLRVLCWFVFRRDDERPRLPDH